jgi:hypothetical protein
MLKTQQTSHDLDFYESVEPFMDFHEVMGGGTNENNFCF